MIFDTVKNIETYAHMNSRIYEGLKLLREDYSQTADGRYEVDGENLFYSIQSYETKEENDFPESHRKYADIQCVLDGTEQIGVGALERMEQLEAYPERDFYVNRGTVDYVTLKPGNFVVLFPQDAHAPGIAPDGKPAPCRKIVVKVLL